MSTFIGGPANGVKIPLRRAPVCLRVVHDPQKLSWDALDQLTDTPKPNEQVHVYICVGNPARYHIYAPPRGSGWIEDGMYHWFPEQPKPGEVHTQEGWAGWCNTNLEKVMAFRSAER